MEINIRDTAIYYEQAGSGRPLILLHGRPLDHRGMVRAFEPLFEDRDGWRRIYPDLPGMGLTKGPAWITHEDHMLDAVVEFIHAITAGERFAVAGTSAGAYLARGVVYRMADKIDGLFLSVPVIDRDTARLALPKHRMIHRDTAFLDALEADEQHLEDFLVVQSADVLDGVRQTVSAAVEIADQPFLDRLWQNNRFSFDVDDLPQPFPAPALFLTGRFDHWCGYKNAFALLDNYPRATFAVLDRAGHALQLEQPGLFRALGREWLNRVDEYCAQRAEL